MYMYIYIYIYTCIYIYIYIHVSLSLYLHIRRYGLGLGAHIARGLGGPARRSGAQVRRRTANLGALGASLGALSRYGDAPRPTQSSFLSPSRSEGVPKGDLSCSDLALGASKGSILLLFEGYFARMDQLARRRAEPHFDSVWASPNEVRRIRVQVKNR